MFDLAEMRERIQVLRDLTGDIENERDRAHAETEDARFKVNLCHDTPDYRRWFRRTHDNKEPPSAFPAKPKPPLPETAEERDAREEKEREEAAFAAREALRDQRFEDNAIRGGE
jgi:hypothetical protein